DMKLKPWGSFEAWSMVVRSAVVWAGLPDPALSRLVFRDDDNADAVLAVIDGLQEMAPNGASTATIISTLGSDDEHQEGEIFKKLSTGLKEMREAILDLCGATKICNIDPQRLGIVLGRYQSRTIGGRRIIRPKRNGIKVWKVVSATTD